VFEYDTGIVMEGVQLAGIFDITELTYCYYLILSMLEKS